MGRKKKEEKVESTEEVATDPKTEAVEEVEADLLGTSARLFPDLETTEEISTEEEEVVEDETGKVIKSPEEAVEEPVIEEEVSLPTYLHLEEDGDKRAKIKVDGQEREVTFAELIKGFQTDRYLTEKGQKLGEERRMLEELKASLSTPPAKVEESIEEDEFTDPKILALNKKIAEQDKKLAQYDQVLGPIQRENTLRNIANTLKGQNPAYDDFMEYVPRIEEQIFKLPVEKQPMYDSELGFTNIYMSLKDAELRTAMAAKETRTKEADQRAKPKVVKVEGGGGSPSGADDSASQYAEAFKRANETGDYRELLKLKGYI